MNSPPSSVVRPSARRSFAVNMRPPVRLAPSKMVAVRPGLLQLVGRVQAGDAGADDGDARRLRTRLGPAGVVDEGGGASTRLQPATSAAASAVAESRRKRRRVYAISMSSSRRRIARPFARCDGCDSKCATQGIKEWGSRHSHLIYVLSRARSSLTRASTTPRSISRYGSGKHLARRALLNGDENLQFPLELRSLPE